MRPRWLAALTVLTTVAAGIAGCQPQPSPQTASSQQESQSTAARQSTPLDAMQDAKRAGDLQLAWSLSKPVLLAYPEDPKIITEVAQLAFENGLKHESADLLVEAVRANDHADFAYVQRAVIGLIAVGRMFDAIDLLNAALTRHPQQHPSRRMLFGFLRGAGNNNAAVSHARRLILDRQIEFEFLLALGDAGEHKLETDSMQQMVARFPADQRPLMAVAKTLVDQTEYAAAESMLQSIVKQHPEYLPAQMLLGRVLVERGSWAALETWSQELSGDYESDWSYWLVLGDWAYERAEVAMAVRAYAESIQRNPDVLQGWTKLNVALNELSAIDAASYEGLGWDNSVQDWIEDRVRRLATLEQLREQFNPQRPDAVIQIVEIASTLRELGRLWEAEAWAAIGMTLPNGSKDRLAETRASILRLLRKDTPWQSLAKQPVLNLGLSNLPAPSFLKHVDRDAAHSHVAKVQNDEAFAVSATPKLSDVAGNVGLTFFGRTRDDLDKPGIPLYATLGCGGGTLDYDLDGWPDLMLMAAGGTPPQLDSQPNALFRNIGGRFIDMTQTSDAVDTGFGQGVAVGDINEDGFPDVLLLNYGVNRVLANQGDGTFRDISDELFTDRKSQWSTSGAIADLDLDGLADMMVVNYCDGFDAVTQLCEQPQTGLSRSCAPTHFPAAADVVYKSNPQGKLVDVTSKWQSTPSMLGRGLGIVVGALDAADGTDVLVANDMTYNHFYDFTATDPPQFSESASLRGLAGDARGNPQGSMGIAVADFDQDQKVDLYVTNFEQEYNTYYQQRSNHTWIDTTAKRNLTQQSLPLVGFGSQAIDFDNDGQQELIVTNGHIDFPPPDTKLDYYQPLQIFRLRSANQFESVALPEQDSYGASLHAGRALWTLDFDRDGQRDVVITHQTEPVALLKNETGTRHHWIAVQLRGTRDSRDAIGSVIQIRHGDQQQTAALTAGDGYLCSNERASWFGLADGSLPIELQVSWPDGSQQTHSLDQYDCHWLIVQAQSATRLPKSRSGEGD
ncbi:FG-GAP-like repeat-containing protein [Novipirellula caenicola]|uniref:Beta-barrel assembly-enhancing protease n=1 Tax=Novipirellula caenicola TaxID=1536901 RepID=A0ABP9VKQ7_9BACT